MADLGESGVRMADLGERGRIGRSRRAGVAWRICESGGSMADLGERGEHGGSERGNDERSGEKRA